MKPGERISNWFPIGIRHQVEIAVRQAVRSRSVDPVDLAWNRVSSEVQGWVLPILRRHVWSTRRDSSIGSQS